MRRMLCVVVLAGCGDNNTLSADAPPLAPDAFEKLDARIDAPPAPPTITITGRAVERSAAGTIAAPDVLIEAFANENEATPLTSTTTDAQGDFSLTITTGGLAISGFLKGKRVGLVDSYLYPATFIEDDIAMVPMQMVSPANFDALSTLGQGGQLSGMGMIALQVLNGPPPGGMPVADATVSSVPAAGAYRYNSTAGLPNVNAPDTHTDGVAYMFNVPPNVPIDVSATKVGSTFATHGMKAWPDSLTTTFIQPP